MVEYPHKLGYDPLMPRVILTGSVGYMATLETANVDDNGGTCPAELRLD